MTSTREARLARVRGAVDREHAEPIRVLPTRPGDFGAIDDPDRVAFDAVAIPIVSEASERNLSGGRAIDPAAWPLAPSVRVGDAVVLVDRDATFEVARVDRDGRSRLVWRLSRT